MRRKSKSVPAKPSRPYLMMGTKARNKLHDYSRDEPDLVAVYGETKHFFVGEWVYGYGVIGLKFPKKTTRQLTPKEVRYYKKKAVALNETFLHYLKEVYDFSPPSV